MSYLNFIDGQGNMNEFYENYYLNNEVMKTLVVGILGKVEVMSVGMKEQF